jgi:hypothetical protein
LAFGAAALGSSGTAIAIRDLVHTLLSTDAAEFPADIAPWVPGEPAPPGLRSVLGRWWSEGFAYVFSWRDGCLHARRVIDPDTSRRRSSKRYQAPPMNFVPAPVVRPASG